MGSNIGALRPDGSGWRARIGVLTHDDSAISESELWTMAPDGVSLHTSRVFFADLATFADPPGPETRQNCLRDCHCRRSFMPGQWAVIFSARPESMNS